jgi:hypothetical protein
MKKSLLLITSMLLPLLTSCQSYTWIVYANPSVDDAKVGQQCRPDIIGLGPHVDLTGYEAMRLGGLTKARTVEYRVTNFHGWGKECIVAHGE